MDVLSALSGTDSAPELICSRKGCKQPASDKILWNNPKIHTPERRKVWLACPEHRGWLENYLRERLLYKETEPITEAAQASSTSDAAAAKE
ncbi:acetone carboxylase [Glutamicibacter uratoxydans]|uniref:acetone carboxylase n=1 Tax=Glutamicibacter uratoxydans TaxID=43667 RepID=UPI003D6ED359